MALCHSMSAGSVEGTLKHCLMQNTLFELFCTHRQQGCKNLCKCLCPGLSTGAITRERAIWFNFNGLRFFGLIFAYIHTFYQISIEKGIYM